MGLFGLSTSEAVYLTRQLNKEQEKRNREQMRLMEQHQKETARQSKEQQEENRQLELQRIAQIATEARQMEPLIILSVYEQYKKEAKQTIAIRASDIKEVESKTDAQDRHKWGDRSYQYEYVGTDYYDYTLLTLWNGKQYKVHETPEGIQAKVNESITRMSEIQTRIIAEASRQNIEDYGTEENHQIQSEEHHQ